MVDFQQLRNADPETVRQAGRRWVTWAGRFEDRTSDYKTKVLERLDEPGVWTGQAANAARDHCGRLRTVMYEHVDEPEDIGKALVRAADDIETCQKRLVAAVNEIESKGDERWRVDASGEVFGPDSQATEVYQYQGEITDIVGEADRADQDCDRKLRAAFEKIGDVDQYVKRERREGRQAAEKLQWYLSNGEEPPGWLQDQLRANADDEFFAAAFGNKLGSAGPTACTATSGGPARRVTTRWSPRSTRSTTVQRRAVRSSAPTRTAASWTGSPT